MAGKYRFYISCMALLAAGVIITVKPDGSCGDNELFGKINPHYYLTGRFSPSKCPCFVNIKRHGIPTDGKDHYLRKEAAESLARLWRDFHKKHPGIPFFVRSSTRNYWDQKWIWENKWTGKTLVDGQNLRSEIKDPCKRALKILEYSSMPGTSRHHWGTDFDINSLMNSYFERGSGKVLYRYMQKNAGRYGFCQPYNAGRERGYKEEKWH